MKKLINTSFVYFILAMAGGVFYREYTKYMGFKGFTVLGLVHAHLLALGVFMFLILALFCMKFNLLENKKFGKFYILYNIGISLTAIMLLVRGLTQVNTAMTDSIAIPIFAGIGHLITFIAVLFMFSALREEVGKTGK